MGHNTTPIFNSVEGTHLKKNVLDLTNDRKLSTKMGKITPIMVMDTVPGDKISIKTSAFVRFAPTIAPFMHKVNVYTHFFFVPNRLVWPNWEDFITGGEDGLQSPVWPHFLTKLETAAPGSLWDYMGAPIAADQIAIPTENLEISAIPFAAYQMIWNEYYRDQNLQIKATDQVIDGDQGGAGALTTMRNRAWQHDYFTSALPWTQKGPEALLPLGTTAPIVAETTGYPLEQIVRASADGSLMNLGQPLIAGTPLGASPPNNQDALSNSIDNNNNYVDLNDTHFADLSQAAAASVIDVRRAFKLQEWLEKNARGGSRYIESIQVHFGVRSSDARLQRPEYLGGSSQPVTISEVLQTSASGSDVQAYDTPQGNMAGHAVSVGGGDYVSKYCEEHGYIIGLMTVMPNSAYQQGLPKHLTRKDKFDYFWPEFQHIGEQPILNQELAIDATGNEETFGYTPRYAEYKFINNSVHGDYRTSLDFWHLGRKFSTMPALNEDFIVLDETEVERIFAVQDGTDNMWCHVLNQVKASRPMAIYGTPKF